MPLLRLALIPALLAAAAGAQEGHARMLQDLRFGFKLLWKEKAFTITALLTLALCIGANTAIFTVLHAVIMAPLPFPEPDRLVSMGNI